MFFGVNMFWALLSAHFSPRYARAKMSLSRAQNIFTPKNINYIVIFSQAYFVIYLYLLFQSQGVLGNFNK